MATGRLLEGCLISMARYIRVFIIEIRTTLPNEDKRLYDGLNMRPDEFYHVAMATCLAGNLDKDFNRIFLTRDGNFNYGMRNLVERTDTVEDEI